MREEGKGILSIWKEVYAWFLPSPVGKEGRWALKYKTIMASKTILNITEDFSGLSQN